MPWGQSRRHGRNRQATKTSDNFAPLLPSVSGSRETVSGGRGAPGLRDFASTQDTWSRGFHPRAAVGLHSSTSTATLRSQVSSTKTHRKRLLLPGLPAQVRELRDAYSTVDSHVAENLERELKVLALEHEGIAVEEAKGMYAIVEHCHSCRIHHGLSTRHDEEEYLKRAASILELILQDLSDVILGSMKLPCKLEVEPRCLSNSYELGQDIWHHGSRVGAFEVYLLVPPVGLKLSRERLRFPGDVGTPEWSPTCGATLELPCGYSVVLLHSKLASNAWLTQDMLPRRLAELVPRGIVEMQVVLAGGQLLPDFAVEIRFKPTPSRNSDGSAGEIAMHFCAQDGLCQVEGVPLKAEMRITVKHPVMETQVLRLVLTRRTARIVLAGDAVVRLWCIDRPGGTAVVMADYVQQNNGVPSSARPLRGQVEQASGENVQIDGVFRLPWRGAMHQFEGVQVLQADGTNPQASLILGHNVTNALCCQIPASGMVRSWMPVKPVQPEEVLFSKPCGAILAALRDVILKMETNFRDTEGVSEPPGEPEPEQEMDPTGDCERFGQLLEQGAGLVSTFIRTASQIWKVDLSEQTRFEAEDVKVLAAAMDDPCYEELVRICESVSGSLTTHQLSQELRQSGATSARDSLAKSVATAYIRAAQMKPWFDTFCRQVVGATGAEVDEARLVGACGSTRILQKMVLSPELSPGSGILSCFVRCQSMEEVTKVVSTICEKLEGRADSGVSAIAAHFLDEDGQIRSDSELSDVGSVVVQVAWRGRPSDPLSTAEVRVVNLILQKSLSLTANIAPNYLVELQDRFGENGIGNSGDFPDVLPVAAMRRVTVKGYHPAVPHHHLQSRNMKDILVRGSFEIAMLCAPEAQLQVVMPESKIPLAAVKVESIDRRQVHTSRGGWCTLALRPGEQKLRLRHDFLGTWTEQSINVSSLTPSFQIPMEMELAVWMTPVTVMGQVQAWEYWIGGCGKKPRQDGSEPFCGKVRFNGRELDVDNGVLLLRSEPVCELHEPKLEDSPGTEEDPLLGFDLEPPFARMASRTSQRPQTWDPHLLGVRPAAPFPAKAGTALVVKACTICCGQPVVGIQIDVDEQSQSFTDRTGVCMLRHVRDSEPEIKAFASHAAFESGCCRYTVTSHPKGPKSVAELPIFLQPLVRLFTVPGPRGQLALQILAGDGDSVLIPVDAEPFPGTIRNGRGEDMLSSSTENPEAIPLSQVRIAPEVEECPIFCLANSEVELGGYEWLPSTEFPAAGSCTYEELLRLREPRTLGHLRPVVHVKDIDDKTLNLALEDCATVDDAAVLLGQRLHLNQSINLSLAAESSVPETCVDRYACGASLLKGSVKLWAGQQLKIMARLLINVTFGNTTLGAPNVQVALRDSNEAATTDSSGVCELVVPAGRHHVRIDHAMSNEGSDEMEIDVSEVETRVEVSVPACLFVYLQAPDSEKGANAPTNVWLCAHQEHLPLTAWPVAGTVLLSDQSGTLEAPLDGEMLRSVELSNALEGKRRPLTLSLALDLSETGYVWRQKGESLLGTQSSWKRLLEKPMSVGRLFPPVTVRAHFSQKSTCIMQVAAFDCRTAGKLCEVMAKRFRKAASSLGVFSEQKRISDDNEVPAWTSVDVWALTQSTVVLRAPCCSRGLSGATVCAYFDMERDWQGDVQRSMDASYVPGSPWAEGSTGGDGRCELMVPDEVHRIEVCHPLLGRREITVDPRGAEGESVLEVFAEPRVRVYSMPPPDQAGRGCVHDADGQEEVWLSVTEPPPEARGSELRGVLVVDGMDGAVRLPDASPATLPWHNSRMGDQCPLQRLRVDTGTSKPGPVLAFSRRLSKGSSRSMACVLDSLVAGPVCVGALLPAVLVHMQAVGGKKGWQQLPAPLAECPTTLALRKWLGSRFSRDLDDVGLYNLSQTGGLGTVLADDTVLTADLELAAAFLSPLKVQVLLPDTQEEQGLSGVTVEVDDMSYGSTDADGYIQLMLPHGKRSAYLRHPSFGDGRRHDFMIPSQDDCCITFADVRLYIFATDPEADADDEDAGCQPSLVWICASAEQIPPDALGIAGSVRCLVGGKDISASLSASRPTEFVVLSGQQVSRPPACSLADLQITASRTGFEWQPKEPSPLAERLEELGGSEYLRLLNCPVAMGYLKPTALVRLDSSTTISISIADHPTAEALRDVVAEKLGLLSATSIQLRLLPPASDDSERLLDDGEGIRPGWMIRAHRMVRVHVSVVTACCGEPLEDVSVTAESITCRTDASGTCQLMLPIGDCRVHLQHASFGEMRQLPLKVSNVEDRKVCYRMKPRLFVYATDPEEQEEEEDPDSVEDVGPSWDPSCVWLAADEGQIPEDAIGIGGSATCLWPSSAVRLRAHLRADQLVGFDLGPTGLAEKSSHEAGMCPVASFRVSCARRGYSWQAKDPSPLAERTNEIGGCEALRLLACPVVLGFLLPRATVHFANRPSMPFSLSEHPEADDVRAILAEEVGENFVLRTVQRNQPISCRFLSHCDLLCAKPDDMAAALASARRFEETKSTADPEEPGSSATTLPVLDLKPFVVRRTE